MVMSSLLLKVLKVRPSSHVLWILQKGFLNKEKGLAIEKSENNKIL